MNSKKIIKESLILWVLVIGLLRTFETLRDQNIFVGQIASLAEALVLLYIPIGLAIKRRERVDYLDLSLADFGSSFILFLFFSLILFPFLIVANHAFQVWLVGAQFQQGGFPGIGSSFLGQLVMVALPEEFFFRGYLQGRLNLVFARRWRILGTSVGPALPTVAALFAISHSLIHFAPWHVLIFFPALAFGWLRDRSGSITASILFHAACNLFSRWVALNYF